MAHRSTNLGRRGRKKRKEELRTKKLLEARQMAERVEQEKRAHYLKEVLPWAIPMCQLSECGIIVEKKIEGSHPRQMFFSKYCANGYVIDSVLGVDDFRIKDLQPWSDIPSDRLGRLVKHDWHPFRPKGLLQRLADL